MLVFLGKDGSKFFSAGGGVLAIRSDSIQIVFIFREENLDRQDNRERQRQAGNDRDQLRPSGQSSSKDTSKTSAGGKGLGGKHSLASKLGGKMKTDSPLIDPNWENWDEDNLDYDDELMLEKKRQLLQRELAKQMTVDGGAAIDPSVTAPGSSAKGQKATSQLNIQPSSAAGTIRLVALTLIKIFGQIRYSYTSGK